MATQIILCTVIHVLFTFVHVAQGRTDMSPTHSPRSVAENKTLRTVTERNFLFQTISNATFSVDTFFFIRYVTHIAVVGLRRIMLGDYNHQLLFHARTHIRQICHATLYGLRSQWFTTSDFAGLEVACWPFVPKFKGSSPAEAVGFLRAKKILSTPSFGREVKPFVPCRIFAACKRTRKCVRGSRRFRSKLPAISHPSSSSFHYYGGASRND